MTYQINKSDGTLLTIINDGLVDENTTSLKLVGRNLVNYGTLQNENFVYLLENFANSSEPYSPLAGQLWFNNSGDNQHLYYYDSSNTWNRIPTIVNSSTSVTQKLGDLWFNTSENSLYIQGATQKILVGPTLDAQTAIKLKNPRTINGVTFDGTSNITVTANTPNPLTPGAYITGLTFNGANANTWAVDVGSPQTPTPSKVVARDTLGDIYFNVGHGVATSARFADLAEKYLTDDSYDIGTVVSVGGTKEVRACQINERAIGVVSGNPAYLMNSTLEEGVPIALKGRVPTKISGIVKKGDRLIAGNNGTAISAGCYGYGNVFAIALEDSNGKDCIEAVIL